MRGMIDGVTHIAARTNGNGACALHACFGAPSSGELYRHDVRERVLEVLPTEYSTAVARLNVPMRHCLDSEVLELSVWSVVREAAVCVLRGRALQVSEQRVI